MIDHTWLWVNVMGKDLGALDWKVQTSDIGKTAGSNVVVGGIVLVADSPKKNN